MREQQDDERRSSIDRRTLLQTTGAGLAGAAVASGSGAAQSDAPEDTLRVGIGNEIASFDPEESSDTTSSLGQSLLYEGLLTNDKSGNVYPWIAESIDQMDVQDIDRIDYEPYMETFETVDDGDGVSVDLGDAFEVLRHPDDPEAPSEPGIEVRILTFEGAAQAAADGTYGMHYRFPLRDEAAFSDGSDLTATDIVASYDRIKGSVNESQYFDSLLYYEAVDDKTLDVYAQVPDAAAPRELQPVAIHPESLADVPLGDLDPRESNVDPMGAGPYKLIDWGDGEYWEYERADDYWVESMGVESFEWFDGPASFPDGPRPERVRLEVFTDSGTKATALENGDLDLAIGFSPSTRDDFDESDGFDVASTESGGYTYIQFPIQAEPWDDERIRQAVNNIVPRESIAEEIYGGWVRPGFTMLPELAQGQGTTDYEQLEDDVKTYNEYNPDRAETLVQEVVDERNLETPIEIKLEVHNDNAQRVSMVERIADEMDSLGDGSYFDTTVETYGWNTYVSRIISPSYGDPDEGLAHIACVGLSGTFNPHSFVDALHHSSNIGACCNLTGIDEDWIDEDLDAARYDIEAVEDPDVRRQRYDQLLRDLEEYAGVAVTHFQTQTTVYSNEVQEFDQWPFAGAFLSYALHSPVEAQALDLSRLPSVRDYANPETGVVEIGGLRDAVVDWRAGNIDSDLLKRVLEAWSSGSSVQ